MTRRGLGRAWVWGIAFGVALLSNRLGAGPWTSPSPGLPEAARSRVVYLTVTDRQGAPILDLGASDFLVREGGSPREIVTAELASAPLEVGVIVDDNGTGLFRAALAQFVQHLRGQASIGLNTVMPQMRSIVPYTTSTDRLLEGVSHLNARPGSPDGGQVLASIYELARDFARREVVRPVIVVLTVGGEEHSTLPAHHVLDQLRKSSASLHVISVANSALRTSMAITRPADLLDGPLNLSEVLGDGPKQTGGRRDEIIAMAGAVSGLQQIATELTHQYRLVYSVPDGVKSSDRLSVAVTRRDLSLRAPTRVPAR